MKRRKKTRKRKLPKWLTEDFASIIAKRKRKKARVFIW